MVDVDTDAAVVAAAYPRTHAPESIFGGPCRIAAGADYSDRRRLRDEDQVALRVGRHRVRAGRLRDGLDQDAGRVDHAEHGSLLRRSRARGVCRAIPVGAGVVAPIALVE